MWEEHSLSTSSVWRWHSRFYQVITMDSLDIAIERNVGLPLTKKKNSARSLRLQWQTAKTAEIFESVCLWGYLFSLKLKTGKQLSCLSSFLNKIIDATALRFFCHLHCVSCLRSLYKRMHSSHSLLYWQSMGFLLTMKAECHSASMIGEGWQENGWLAL